MVAPIMKPASDLARGMQRLRRDVDAADDDGRVTRAEQRDLVDHVGRLEARAEGMVAHTGAPALRALDDVKGMIRSRRFPENVDRAMTKLADGRHAMWREARHDARTDPFTHLRGYRKPMGGVREKDFDFEGKRVHVVAVDLANPRIKLQTTGAADKGRTIDDMARRKNAEIAINGDFFSLASFAPSGAAMQKGDRWGGAEAWEPALVFRGQHAQMKGYNSPVPSWATNAVSARPTVLRDGRVVTDYPEADKALPSRRTGVGVSQSGRVLYLVAAEGNMSAKDLGRLMKRVGADDAMAMDAGGSAQMWREGRGYVQRSSDPGGTRRVANAILINRTGRG